MLQRYLQWMIFSYKHRVIFPYSAPTRLHFTISNTMIQTNTSAPHAPEMSNIFHRIQPSFESVCVPQPPQLSNTVEIEITLPPILTLASLTLAYILRSYIG